MDNNNNNNNSNDYNERRKKIRRNRKKLERSQKINKNASKKICVGDKLLVYYMDEELIGYCHFHGCIDHGMKGFIEYYGIELGNNEGVSDGQFIFDDEKDNDSKSARNRQYFFPNNKRSAVFLKRKHILTVLKPINGKRLTIGDKVEVKGRGKGTIKFIGPTLFGPHIWYGIQLNGKLGRSNGMVKGVRYFECQTGYGIFVRENKLTPLDKNGRPINIIRKYVGLNPQQLALKLFDACSRGDTKTVRNLLLVDKSIARIARDTQTDATALMTASYHGYYQIVYELLNTKKINIDEQNFHGMTALHMGSQMGHTKIVELLLKFNADPDIRTEDGTTALYYAVEKGHNDVVEELLKSFADVNLSSRDNESPLIQACHRGYHKIVLSLLRAPNIRINQKRKTDGATALFVAGREGSVECVKHLLSNPSIFINEPKTNGRGTLFITSFFGHVEIVKLLLNHSDKMKKNGMKHGILDVNQCDSKGFTPLFVAAQNGHNEIVELLLRYKADVNLAEQRGHTPLWIAALRGHVNVVRTLLSHPKIDIDFKDLSGVTALWAACQNNNADVVELLLHPRSIIAEYETDDDGHKTVASLTGANTALFESILNDINNGFDDDDDIESQSNKKTKYDESKYDGFAKANNVIKNLNAGFDSSDDDDNNNNNNNNNDESLKIKSSHFRKPSSQMPGYKPKKTREIKGANPNLAKHDGCTPLWIAASRGNHECMKPLITYGADLNKADRSQGATPLFVACQNGKKSAVDLLLAASADVNRPRTGDGTSPLMMASHNGHVGIVDVLLKSGADPLQANTTGLNALGCAAMQGHAEIVKLAHQHLLNVKTEDEITEFVNTGDGVNGWTPLHLACMGGHTNVIKFLIQTVKVDIFKKDYENKTGLEHAWQNGHQNIVSWLSQLEHQYSSQM